MKMAEFQVNEQLLKQALTQAMESATVMAVNMFAAETVRAIFAPRPTKIMIENGVPANLTIAGKKGKPQAVYVTTKRLRANYAPALFFGAVAFGCYALMKYREKDVEII